MPKPDPSPDEYDLKPDPVEEIPPPPRSSPPRPLQYRSRNSALDKPNGPGRPVEVTVGFFSYIGVISAMYFLFIGNLGSGISIGVLAWFPLLALGGLAIYLQGYRGWRGFIPGILLGLGLSCLIGVGGVIWLVATCRGM